MDNPEEFLSPFDIDNGAADKISPPPDFDGPVRKRRITDPLCFLVLAGMWGVATWLGVWTLQKGNYSLLVNPIDYKGRICGVDEGSNGVILPSKWHAVDQLSNGVCIDECPTEINLEPASRSDLICKDDVDLLLMAACLDGGAISDDPNVLVTCGGCMYSVGIKEMKHDCVPESVADVVNKFNVAAEALALDPLTDWTRFKLQSYITRFFKDMHTALSIVAGIGIGCTIFFSVLFLVLFMFPKCIPITVWVSAILVPLTLGGGGAFLFFLSSDYEEDQSGVHSEFKALAVKVLSFATWAIAGIFFIVLFILRQKINLAISITKAAVRAVREVRLCITFPFLQLVSFLFLFIAMVLYSALLATTGVMTTQTDAVFNNEVEFTAQEFTSFGHYRFWFMMLVFLLTSAFIITLGQLTLSLCYSQWYFTPEKDEGNSVSIFSCLLTVLTKHAGTAAFAAFTAGPIVFIRAPFLLVQKCIRNSAADNIFIDAIICSCQCCFFGLERFLKFTSKNAFIQTAIFGYSYCKSSHESYYLIKRNGLRVAAAGPVGFLCTFFTRVTITSLVCLLSYFSLDKLYGPSLFSIVSVVAMIGVIAWFIAGFFTETIGMSVTTLFQCFLVDEEMLGNQGSLYVPNEIDEFLARLDEAHCARMVVPNVVKDDGTVHSEMPSQSMPESQGSYPSFN